VEELDVDEKVTLQCIL